MQCHQNSDNDAREKANRNEHIGNGVLIFACKGKKYLVPKTVRGIMSDAVSSEDWPVGRFLLRIIADISWD